jgi:hypothetical protein
MCYKKSVPSNQDHEDAAFEPAPPPRVFTHTQSKNRLLDVPWVGVFLVSMKLMIAIIFTRVAGVTIFIIVIVLIIIIIIIIIIVIRLRSYFSYFTTRLSKVTANVIDTRVQTG